MGRQRLNEISYMDRLRKRVEQELELAAAAGRPVCDIELVAQLAPEFSSECGQTDVRAAVVLAMRRRRLHLARLKPAMDARGNPGMPNSRGPRKSS
jgi:hypothetical protein